MHSIPFSLKRCHYSSLDKLRPIAAQFELTPARIDLLYALHAVNGSSRNPFQCVLAMKLGVARSTVCKMLRGLEKAGFLERQRPARGQKSIDRRFRRIVLTRFGRRRFARVLKLFRRRVIGRVFYRAIQPMLLSRDDRCLYLGRMIDRVQRVARGLGDESHLYR